MSQIFSWFKGRHLWSVHSSDRWYILLEDCMPVWVFSPALELEGNNRWVKKTIIYFYHFWLKIDEHLIFMPIWKKETNKWKAVCLFEEGRENILLSCGGESLKTVCQCVWSLVRSWKGYDLEFRVSWLILINQRMKIVIASCI